MFVEDFLGSEILRVEPLDAHAADYVVALFKLESRRTAIALFYVFFSVGELFLHSKMGTKS